MIVPRGRGKPKREKTDREWAIQGWITLFASLAFIVWFIFNAI